MALRRSMAESDEANWTPRMDSEEEGIFDDSDSIFDNTLQDTSNPRPITYAEDQLPEVPIEKQKQYLQVQNLRRTLVAMDSPRGILVARAIRNVKNGTVKHLEAFRPPTQAELKELATKGVKVNTGVGKMTMADSNLGATDEEKKGLFGLGMLPTIGIAAVVAGGGWWLYTKYKDKE